MKGNSGSIWVWVHHREGLLEEVTFALIAEARRFLSDPKSEGRVIALVLGSGLEPIGRELGAQGVDEVICIESEAMRWYQGELFSLTICKELKRAMPEYLFMAQSPETDDLAPRLAALLESPLVTRVVDLKVDERGEVFAIRPVSNGFLFEEIRFTEESPALISFLPSVLTTDEAQKGIEPAIRIEQVEGTLHGLRVQVLKRIEADPGDLDLEEAEIIVSVGRGAWKGEDFRNLRELAQTLGGSLGGTRPVIDQQILPFERQIGQTGKSVSPRLIINCGISGANEYTAGMEKSKLTVAINNDPRARIFRFADLGIVADVHEVLPLLLSRLKELHQKKKSNTQEEIGEKN